MAMEVAVERYHLPRNEAKLVDTIKPTKPQIKHLSEEQVLRLLEAVESHRLELLYYFALTYGFRKGELLGLIWSDIDLKKGTIKITGSLQEHKRGRRTDTHEAKDRCERS